MPSNTSREPEVEISEDDESGFVVNIYDGEYLIQVRPHENGYRLSLASKEGMGDTAFLRTYGRKEGFRQMFETEFDAIDEEAVFEILGEHFADREYRTINLKKSIKHFTGWGARSLRRNGRDRVDIGRRTGLPRRPVGERRHLSAQNLAD